MKRTLISTIAAASLVGLGIGAVATADDHKGKSGKHSEKRAEMLQQFDTNGDGQLDETERETAKLAKFSAIDTDGSGSLTKSEITAHMTKKMTERVDERFAKGDANGDGVISVEEFSAAGKERRGKRGERRAEMLEKFDTDGDGQLSETERQAARDAGFGRGRSNRR